MQRATFRREPTTSTARLALKECSYRSLSREQCCGYDMKKARSAPVFGSRETGVSGHFCCHGIGSNRRAIPRANSAATGTAIMITAFTPIFDATSIKSRLCVFPSKRLNRPEVVQESGKVPQPQDTGHNQGVYQPFSRLSSDSSTERQ